MYRVCVIQLVFSVSLTCVIHDSESGEIYEIFAGVIPSAVVLSC